MTSRRALVIGDSAGIGQAIVRRLVADGYQVIGVARRDPTFTHERYSHVQGDVRAHAFRDQLTKLLDGLGGPLDVCIYASGIGHLLDFADMTHDADVFTTNLTGIAVTAEVVIPRMIAAKQGHFVGLSSQADKWVDAEAPSYGASKAGMSAYLHGLAFPCRAKGVAVTNIRFGFVDTEMSRVSEVRPFLITADKAAHIVARCLAKRPIRYTYPKRMAMLLWLGGIPRRLRVLFS